MCCFQTHESILYISRHWRLWISRRLGCCLLWLIWTLNLSLTHRTQHFYVMILFCLVLFPSLTKLLAYQMWLICQSLIKSKLCKVPLLLNRFLASSHSRSAIEVCQTLTVKFLIEISTCWFALLWSCELHITSCSGISTRVLWLSHRWKRRVLNRSSITVFLLWRRTIEITFYKLMIKYFR